MNEQGEVINLIDLGKPTAQRNQRNEYRSSDDDQLNEHLFLNLEQSVLFSEIKLTNGQSVEMMSSPGEFAAKHSDPSDESTNGDLNNQNRNKKSLIRSKFNLAINNSVLNTRNNYEKLTDLPLIKTDNKYYGSFSKAKTSETAFSNVVTTNTNDDHRSITTSINSQNLLSIYLKEFEQEKHLNLLGFKTILIVILAFCFLISLIYTFIVYATLTEDHLAKSIDKDKDKTVDYWRTTWIVNSIITLLMLSLGIVGLVKEKVILILITSVYMMFNLIESDDPINGLKIFNISLLTILSTSVLLVVFAAR